MKKIRIIFVMALLFLFCEITWAQTMGTISGVVQDDAGAVLPGAKVVILNEDTGLSRTLETDGEGRYSAPSLALGSYRITTSHEGFKTSVRSGIDLTVGREAVVTTTLEVGNVAEEVDVSGDAPLVESTQATLGSLVESRTIRELPLNGRSYDQLALIQPGVTTNDTGTGLTASTFIYGTGKRFSVGGQRSNANSFLLDGTNISDQANGTPGGGAGTNLGVETILEFKVFTNSFKAEYGRNSGSIVSAVTRSGTNAFHGTAFEYLRNSALDAKNYFDVGSNPPPFKRNQFGGVLGGPIKKDKLFFFGGYEGLRQGLATTLSATVPTALAKQGILPTGTVPVNPASVPYLNLFPDPNGRDFGNGIGEYLSSPTATTVEDNAMGRVDYKLSDKTSIFGRYTFDQDEANTPLNIPPQALVLSSRRQYITLQANTVLNTKALNNFRFAFNRTHNFGDSTGFTNLSLVPGQPFGTLSIGAVTNAASSTIISQIGTGKGNGQYQWDYNVFQWGDDFSYVKDKHSLKFGVDVQRFRDNNIRTVAVRGALTFDTFADLLAGTPSNFQAGYPVGETPHFAIRQSLLALYAQDDYTVNSRLTLNLGMRWEITTDPYDANGNNAILPSPAATDTTPSDAYLHITKKNFEPRFGLAWQLNSSGKTVLRTGGGIYHNQILPWLFPNQAAIYPFFGQLSVNDPPFPDPIQSVEGATIKKSTVALNIMNPLQKVPTSYQFNTSVQQQLSRNTVVEISYAGSINVHQPILKELNTFVPTICSTSLANCPPGLPDGTKYYPAKAPRINPTWKSIRWNSDDGRSSYNAGTIELRQQSSSGFVGKVHYTYAKSLDQGSNVGNADGLRSPSAVMDPSDPRRDWGLSDYSMKHSFGASGTYPVPFRATSRFAGAIANNWTINGIATVQSGLPFTVTLDSSQSRDGSNVLADRPNLVPGSSNNPTSGVSAGCPGFAAGTPVGNAMHWFDPCAFTLQPIGTYGNVGRNTLIGPGLMDVDLGLEKAFHLSEAATATFRFEMFNVLNHANFGLPNTIGVTTEGTANPTAGLITYTTTSSRQLQFALRVNF